MRKWIIIGSVALVVAIALGMLVVTSGGSSKPKALLITDTAVARDLRDEVTVPGTLERAEQRTVSAVSSASGASAASAGGATATVNNVFLKDGSPLNSGDAILSLDGRRSVAYPGTLPFFRRLDVGAEGADVLQLKQILRTEGFQPGALDQRYTEQTRFALGQWQASKGYPGAAPSTNQAVNVSVQQGAGYQLGAQTSAGLTITPPPVRRAVARFAAPCSGSPAVAITANAARVTKGTPITYVVNASCAPVLDTDVVLNIAGATAGADYVLPAGFNAATTPVSGTVTIPIGATSTILSISTVPSSLVEADKTLTVSIAADSAYTLGSPDSASTTLVTNALPQLTVSGTTSVAQGQSATVRVTADQAPVKDTQVNFTVGGTALADTDYVAFAPSVLLRAGQTQASLTIATKTSDVVKPDRRIVLALAPSTAYTIGAVNTATITILGQTGSAATPVVTLAATNLRVNAGQPAQFVVSLDRALSQPLELTLGYGGDAVMGSDYNPAGGIVTVPAGQTSLSVTVPTLNNGLVQDDKTLSVGLVAQSTYVVGSPSQAEIVIVSATLPKISISANASAVGLGGGAVFTLVADQPPVKDTSVQYTVTGTAQQGKDIQPVTGSAVLPAGQTRVDIVILTLNTNVFFLPTDMIVTTNGGRLGQVFVKEGQIVPPATPLFTITEADTAVTIDASAADRTKLKVGQTATVQVQGATTSVEGVITQLDDSPTTDATSKKQTFQGKLQLRGDLNAATGTPVTAKVVVEERLGALTVPIAAVKQNGDGQDVVRVIDLRNGGRTREVRVETGLSEGSYIEITSGLAPRDVVVVELNEKQG